VQAQSPAALEHVTMHRSGSVANSREFPPAIRMIADYLLRRQCSALSKGDHNGQNNGALFRRYWLLNRGSDLAARIGHQPTYQKGIADTTPP